MNPTVVNAPPNNETETRAQIEHMLTQAQRLSEETRTLQTQIDESQRNTLERIEFIRQLLVR